MSFVSIVGIGLSVAICMITKCIVALNLEVNKFDEDGKKIVLKPANWNVIIYSIILGLINLFFVAAGIFTLWNTSIFGISINL